VQIKTGGTLQGHGWLVVDLPEAGDRDAVEAQYYVVQLLAIRQEQGRMGELEQPAREFVQRYPEVPAWRVGLARVLLEIGRMDEARAEFDALAARGFEDIPRTGTG
jgi:predicted Zn-dependent protease